MGGFMEYEGNRPIRVLFPEQLELESYSLTGNGDFPRISKAEIKDKSKGDAISKGAVIVQTGWFVTQCIARGVQGPITELELVTVAFAALNLMIYLLWWDKPLHVQRGVRVYKKRITEETVDDGDVEATVGFWDPLRDALSTLPAAIIRGPSVNEDDFDSWLARVLTWPFVKPVYIIFTTGNHEEHERRVDTFYPNDWVEASETFSILLVAAITLAFGGIHCIGWSFTFPSSTERTFWRVASLSITCVPVTLFPFGIVGTALDNILDKFGIGGFCANIIMVSQFCLYILSRLALLILPFLCLRSLPLAAFHIVHWTSFIPHV